MPVTDSELSLLTLIPWQSMAVATIKELSLVTDSQLGEQQRENVGLGKRPAGVSEGPRRTPVIPREGSDPGGDDGLEGVGEGPARNRNQCEPTLITALPISRTSLMK